MSTFSSFYDLAFNDGSSDLTDQDFLNARNNSALEALLLSYMHADPERLKNFLRNQSELIASNDFIIDDTTRGAYTKSFPGFDNNGTLLTFEGQQLVFTVSSVNKMRLRDANSVSIRVFLDGMLLPGNQYAQYQKTSAFGSIRVFLPITRFPDGTSKRVTIEVRNIFNESTHYQLENIVSFADPATYFDYYSFTFDGESAIGTTYSCAENVIAFVKQLGDTQYRCMERLKRDENGSPINPTTAEYEIEENGNGTLTFSSLNTRKLYKDEVILISNKLQFTFLEYFSTNHPINDLTPHMTEGRSFSLPLITTAGRIFPVDDAKELDVFISGVKLIPDIDYLLDVDAHGFLPVLKLSATPRPGQQVFVCNRPYSISMSLDYHVDSVTDTEGFINLPSNLPIDLSYLDVYANRKKVHPNQLSIVGDNILRITDLIHNSKIEVRTRFAPTNTLAEFLDLPNNGKSLFQQVVDLMGYSNFIADYKSENSIGTANNITNNNLATDEYFKYCKVDNMSLVPIRKSDLDNTGWTILWGTPGSNCNTVSTEFIEDHVDLTIQCWMLIRKGLGSIGTDAAYVVVTDYCKFTNLDAYQADDFEITDPVDINNINELTTGTRYIGARLDTPDGPVTGILKFTVAPKPVKNFSVDFAFGKYSFEEGSADFDAGANDYASGFYAIVNISYFDMTIRVAYQDVKYDFTYSYSSPTSNNDASSVGPHTLTITWNNSPDGVIYSGSVGYYVTPKPIDHIAAVFHDVTQGQPAVPYILSWKMDATTIRNIPFKVNVTTQKLINGVLTDEYSYIDNPEIVSQVYSPDVSTTLGAHTYTVTGRYTDGKLYSYTANYTVVAP
jgi:hypothetical protein